jgi:hypothetical protein
MRTGYLLTLWVLSALTLGLQATTGAEQAMLPVSILLMIPLVVMATEDIRNRRHSYRTARRDPR